MSFCFLEISKEVALNRMNLAITQFTDHLIIGTAVSAFSYSRTYTRIYEAVYHHRLKYQWVDIMRSSAERLVVKFRNNHIEYKRCARIMRGICRYAERRFCKDNNEYHVQTTFDRVWNQWHSDKELRGRLLWGIVRAMRVKIATLAWLLKTYEEVSLRPENTGYAACKERFEAVSSQQRRKRKLSNDWYTPLVVDGAARETAKEACPHGRPSAQNLMRDE
jgi:hypothetical protein